MIYNRTKKIRIADSYKLCKTVLSKSLGLMFTVKFRKPLIFVFSSHMIIPLHMFFVFYPIDVLWLDSEKIVVELKKGFRPFSFFTPKRKASYVIELKEGTIASTETRVGDTIEF